MKSKNIMKAIGSNTSRGIFLSVIRKRYDLFKRITKKVSNRIFKTFGLNPISHSEKMNWDTFLNFRRIIISYNAPKN